MSGKAREGRANVECRREGKGRKGNGMVEMNENGRPTRVCWRAIRADPDKDTLPLMGLHSACSDGLLANKN